MQEKERQRIIQRFEDWWHRDNRGLPLMRVIAIREDPPLPIPKVIEPANREEQYTRLEFLHSFMQYYIATHEYMADAFPSFGANFGPGSLALYLGAEPRFEPDTVWGKQLQEDELIRLTITVPVRYERYWEWCKALYSNPDAVEAFEDRELRIVIPLIRKR